MVYRSSPENCLPQPQTIPIKWHGSQSAFYGIDLIRSTQPPDPRWQWHVCSVYDLARNSFFVFSSEVTFLCIKVALWPFDPCGSWPIQKRPKKLLSQLSLLTYNQQASCISCLTITFVPKCSLLSNTLWASLQSRGEITGNEGNRFVPWSTALKLMCHYNVVQKDISDSSALTTAAGSSSALYSLILTHKYLLYSMTKQEPISMYLLGFLLVFYL